MATDPGRTALYRLYDDHNWLLYVGITGDPVARLAQHKAEKRWWREVHHHTVEWYETRAAAAAAEISAIRHSSPWYNREHSRGAEVILNLAQSVHVEGLDLLCRMEGHQDRERLLGTLLIRELAARGLLGDAPCFHTAFGWPEGLIIRPEHYGDDPDALCSCGARVSDPPDCWYQWRLAIEAADAANGPAVA